MPLRPLKLAAATAAALVGLVLIAPAAALAAPGDPGDPVAAARVAVVYALKAPESRSALIPADALELYTSPTGALTRDLDAVIDTPVAIGIDPMILASIRVLGTEAPASAVEWLDRLAQATNETFPLSYADSDITLPLQAGAAAVLAPTSFDFAIDPARFAAAVTPDPTATSTPTATAVPPGGAPQLPTTESLLAWNYTAPGLAWPVAGSVVSSDLARITASGYTTTMLSSGNVEKSVRSQATATIDGSPVVVTDDGLSLLLNEAVSAPTLAEWQSSDAVLQSAITTAALDGGATGSTVVLAVDRDTLGSLARLGTALSIMDSLAVADVTTLSSVLATPASAATVVDQPQTATRITAAQTLLTTETADAAFSTVAANPLLITGERRLSLLTTLSTAWNAYPGGWGSALTLFAEQSEGLQNSVRVVKSSDITLVADRASLPVTISNSLGQPVTVLVTVTAPTPLLEIEETAVPVTIEPDSQKRGQIPVQSLSNGTAQIVVSITSATGVAVGQPTSVRINVYAGWETPITVALSIAVVAVFAFGIARVILRRRRARARSAEPEATE